LAVFNFVLGIIFGSFVNVLIERIPKNISIVLPSSYCPACKKTLKWWHNIPLLSWLILKGKCYYCKEKISFLYPAIELACGIIFLLVFLKNPVFYFSIPLSIIFSIFLALSIIDLRYKKVPDSLNLFALTVSLFLYNDYLSTLTSALILSGSFSLLRFFVGYYLSVKNSYFLKNRFKKTPWLKNFFSDETIEALGEGDIIIAATIGAVLGTKDAFLSVVTASLLAIPFSIYFKISKKETELPFIPFLSSAAFLVFLWR
jgi:leader peptidase (prepilin peptidase)/N-methyltransferase